jgi:hypothetical protein
MTLQSSLNGYLEKIILNSFKLLSTTETYPSKPLLLRDNKIKKGKCNINQRIYLAHVQETLRQVT